MHFLFSLSAAGHSEALCMFGCVLVVGSEHSGGPNGSGCTGYSDHKLVKFWVQGTKMGSFCFGVTSFQVDCALDSVDDLALVGCHQSHEGCHPVRKHS